MDGEVRKENKSPSHPFLPLNTLGGLHLPCVLQDWHLGADWLVLPCSSLRQALPWNCHSGHLEGRQNDRLSAGIANTSNKCFSD